MLKLWFVTSPFSPYLALLTYTEGFTTPDFSAWIENELDFLWVNKSDRETRRWNQCRMSFQSRDESSHGFFCS